MVLRIQKKLIENTYPISWRYEISPVKCFFRGLLENPVNVFIDDWALRFGLLKAYPHLLRLSTNIPHKPQIMNHPGNEFMFKYEVVLALITNIWKQHVACNVRRTANLGIHIDLPKGYRFVDGLSHGPSDEPKKQPFWKKKPSVRNPSDRCLLSFEQKKQGDVDVSLLLNLPQWRGKPGYPNCIKLLQQTSLAPKTTSGRGLRSCARSPRFRRRLELLLRGRRALGFLPVGCRAWQTRQNKRIS